MKKKGTRSIPDFSGKRDRPGTPTVAQQKGAPPPAPRVKPQATSAKSGRRGQ